MVAESGGGGSLPARESSAASALPSGASGASGAGFGPDVIAAAEKVAGVEYTDAERVQVATRLDGWLDQVRARRALGTPRELAPALVFDPRLPGQPVRATARRATVRLSRVARTSLPADERDIAFAGVAQLGDWLRRRAITSEHLTEICLRRLERHGPALECVVTLTPELALEQARIADRELRRGRVRGPLHGIPYGAKDLLDTQGIATTYGAEPFKERVAASDAAVVERLRAAGAVLVGKLTLGALAYGDIWFGGRTRNPWNTAEGSSGSSAGSAAAVAAGLVPFAIGTETLGSITSPSFRCGITGLRPTFGRVSREGAMPLCWSMDKIGPLCRSVEDTVAVLAAIDGASAGDPSSIDASSLGAAIRFDARANVKGRRVGFDPAWFDGDEPGKAVDRRALEALETAGLVPVEIELPPLPYSSMMPILFAEAAAAFEDLTLTDRDDLLAWQGDDAWPSQFRAARFLSAVDLIGADRLRRRVMGELGAVLDSVDAVLSPTFAGSLLLATNFTGHPSLTLRAGFEDRALEKFNDQSEAPAAPTFRAPRAVTLYGRLFDDGALCEIGRAIEQALGVGQQRPPSF